MLTHRTSYAAFCTGLSLIALTACWAGDADASARAKKRDDVRKIEKAPAIPPGPLQIIVSINSQRATLYADGIAVAHSAVSTGTPGHPTPMGVFSVIQKHRHHVSNLYDAEMPFMQRITWSGSALHQGPLPGYPASHGCIRLTRDFAELLWKVTKLGARVIVTKPDVAPVPIENEHLFVPAPPVLAKVAEASLASAAGNPQAVAKIDASLFTGSVTIKPHPTGPISVFVSRKEGRLYVRQATHPLFDVPVTIKNPDAPIGTHVYTAMALKDDGAAFQWNAISIPSAYPHMVKSAKLVEHKGRKHREVTTVMVEPAPAPNASQALDRLELPPDVLTRIEAMITPGSSLIVSDNKLSDETGESTDFIVLTK